MAKKICQVKTDDLCDLLSVTLMNLPLPWGRFRSVFVDPKSDELYSWAFDDDARVEWTVRIPQRVLRGMLTPGPRWFVTHLIRFLKKHTIETQLEMT